QHLLSEDELSVLDLDLESGEEALARSNRKTGGTKHYLEAVQIPDSGKRKPGRPRKTEKEKTKDDEDENKDEDKGNKEPTRHSARLQSPFASSAVGL
ncbi:hypothetical protein BGX27_000619, partial [Mortierella sp. AM989]